MFVYEALSIIRNAIDEGHPNPKDFMAQIESLSDNQIIKIALDLESDVCYDLIR